MRVLSLKWIPSYCPDNINDHACSVSFQFLFVCFLFIYCGLCLLCRRIFSIVCWPWSLRPYLRRRHWKANWGDGPLLGALWRDPVASWFFPWEPHLSVFGCLSSAALHSLQRRLFPLLSAAGHGLRSGYSLPFNPCTFSLPHPSFLFISSRGQTSELSKSRKRRKGFSFYYFSQTMNTTFLPSTLSSPGDRKHGCSGWMSLLLPVLYNPPIFHKKNRKITVTVYPSCRKLDCGHERAGL